MDDIESVIKEAKRLQQFSERPGHIYAHKQSDLPASIDDMKQSIKDRINILAGAYISLASYISDEEYKVLFSDDVKTKRRVYLKITTVVEQNRKEIQDFDILQSK